MKVIQYIVSANQARIAIAQVNQACCSSILSSWKVPFRNTIFPSLVNHSLKFNVFLLI